jgi:adenylate kinase family enzyme
VVDLPERVLVIGSGGAGKTVLSNELGALLGLPVTHLDPLLYDEHWVLTPPADFRARQHTVIGGDRWIIDGTYRGTLAMRLAAADTVILLDLPTRVCAWRVVRRRMRYGAGQHPDGVFATASWTFLRHVLTFRRRHRRAVLDAVAAHGARAALVHLTSRDEVRAYVAELRAVRRQEPAV